MASKLRVDEIVGAQGSTVSIGTATFTGGLSGDITGLNVTGVITATTLNQTLGAGSSITIGNTVITSTSIGIGTTTTEGRNAGVGTAVGTLIYNSTDGVVQVYNGTGWDLLSNIPFTATGGTKDTTSRSGYAVHTFTSPGTFAVTGTPATVEYLVVAGGGGAAAQTTVGGGGAGGFRSGTLAVFPGDYTVTRGGGGAGGPWDTDGSKGANSVFGPITATGGGFGGADETQGGPGGSGGGSGGSGGTARAGGPGNEGGYTPVEGYDGGPNKPARTAPYTSGGGGVLAALVLVVLLMLDLVDLVQHLLLQDHQ